MNKFYVTTPIYYVNASPHIGHAYTNIIVDCLARFKRSQDYDVFFLTGTDEHGEKIKKAAEHNGQVVQVFVDTVMGNFKSLWETLDVSYDFFIRTTHPEHIAAVQKVISCLYEKGDIYKKKYRGFYCMPCETFWNASQVKEAEGCPDCKRAVEEIEEENYFFRLSRYEEWLKKYLADNPGFVRPRIRANEVNGFLESQSLADLCISRPKKRVSWGVEFPLDPEYVVYVWFDALINYISGVGFGASDERFKTWWPADFHFMAKDILRHHAVFWPIMLKALDLPMPKVIYAHGWWKMGEEKMSKSKGNIVNPFDLIKDVGVDGLRYFLLREIPVGVDGNFSLPAVINRVNSDLANDLGNLVYRTLNMAEKYMLGNVVSSACILPEKFKSALDALEQSYVPLMENAEFSLALEKIFAFISVMNKYIEETKPWILWKEKKIDAITDFLYALLEGIRIVSSYIYPFMPQTAASIQRQLGFDVVTFNLVQARWAKNKTFNIRKEAPLFPRIEIEEKPL